MTTLSEAREAMYQHFNTGWASFTPITFDNEKFTPPDTGGWVRLAVRHQFAGQESLGSTGNRKFRRLGTVFIQCFVENGEGGLDNADSLAQRVQTIFEGTRITGTTVRFLDVNIREIGPEDDGKWYQFNVEADFEYDEIK